MNVATNGLVQMSVRRPRVGHAIGLLITAVVVLSSLTGGVGALMLQPEVGGTQSFDNGGKVAPTVDQHTIYVESDSSAVSCTVNTSGGQRVRLTPPTGPSTIRNARRGSPTRHAVADLPTDRGRLKVWCEGKGMTSKSTLYLDGPRTSSQKVVAAILFGVPLVFFSIVGFVIWYVWLRGRSQAPTALQY